MIRALKVRHFFKTREKEQIVAAIQKAEALTSGEIRVHVESYAGPDPVDRARQVFETLGMAKTALQNGVLIYLAVTDRKFAIIGDAGIDRVVPRDFWNDTKEKMQNLFREGKFAAGVCHGIEMAGLHLAQYFPCRPDDVNELKNDISEGF